MLCTIFIALSVLLFSVNAQDCSQMPIALHPSECCPSFCPKFMTHALAEECGLPNITMHCNWALGWSRSSGGLTKPPSPPTCASVQCILKKNNLLTANKMDKTEFKNFIKKQFSAEWKPAIVKAISTCDAEADKPDDCDGRRYIMCIKRNMFVNCPDPVAVQSSDCSSLRAFMEKCPMPISTGQ